MRESSCLSYKVISFSKLYLYLLSCRIILGFARLRGNGLRGRQTPMGDRRQAGVCTWERERVCVRVSE